VGNNPYKILFGHDDWTCSIAEFTGTHQGTMMSFEGSDSKLLVPVHTEHEDFHKKWHPQVKEVQLNDSLIL